MCGIAGFLSFKATYSESDLKNITNVLNHRGPDASGFYYDKFVGLGHRRLSIIDLSDSANQPIYSHCGRYLIIFNGEIYNFKEIANDLEVKLKTTSDTEVLIEAFVKWGVSFVERLNGMFAFTIYDTQEKELFIYRDRLGIKPMYYMYDGDNFVFSSELKSFKKINVNLGGIDKQAINDFLYLGYIPSPLSIYKNVKKFPSGCFARVSEGKFKIEPYWSLEEQVQPKVLTNYKDAKAQLKDLLFDAVDKRMISDVPLGTFLSGGIDSSLITAIAQKISSKPIDTFTIGFSEEKFNEAEFAEKVATNLGTNHHHKVLSYQDALDRFESLSSSYDEPFADSSSFSTMLVSEFAAEHVKVILSGDGGDESYLGYGTYEWGKRLKLPGVRLFRSPISKVLKLGPNRYKRASSLFEYPTESRLKSHIFSQEQYYFTEIELSKIINPSLVCEFSFNEMNDNLSRSLSIQESQSLFDMRYYLQDDLLVKVDRASMQNSLEVRVPLIDHRLIAFSLNLDGRLRKKHGESKFLLKEVLYELVPRELFDRPKRGFGVPLIEWLRKEWKFLIEDYLNKQAIDECGVFNNYIVQQYVQRFLSGEYYLYNRIWLLILIQKFFIDESDK